ncbi:MAG: hypothetical protein JJE04_15805 [Acidobacteriia bacterium]|nr:hypothetical protein [Terriglobia bacterium]
MNKPVIGLALGAGLGFLDGLTAWFTPEVRPLLAGILVGSSMKGMLVGLAAGLLARKVNSAAIGVGFAFLMAMGLAWFVASFPSETGKFYYWEIMVPGSIVGAIVGFATQRYGKSA